MASRNSALYKHSGSTDQYPSNSYTRNYNVQEFSESTPATFAHANSNRASRTVEVTDLDRLLDNPSLSDHPPSLPPKGFKSSAPNIIASSNSPQRTIFPESSNLETREIVPPATNAQSAPLRPPVGSSPQKAIPASPSAPLSPMNNSSKLDGNDSSEGEVYLLKQKLQQLEFYKRRCNELSSQNAQFVEERQRLEELLNSSRRNEESAIEQQVQSLVQLDQFKC